MLHVFNQIKWSITITLVASITLSSYVDAILFETCETNDLTQVALYQTVAHYVNFDKFKKFTLKCVLCHPVDIQEYGPYLLRSVRWTFREYGSYDIVELDPAKNEITYHIDSNATLEVHSMKKSALGFYSCISKQNIDQPPQRRFDYLIDLDPSPKRVKKSLLAKNATEATERAKITLENILLEMQRSSNLDEYTYRSVPMAKLMNANMRRYMKIREAYAKYAQSMSVDFIYYNRTVMFFYRWLQVTACDPCADPTKTDGQSRSDLICFVVPSLQMPIGPHCSSPLISNYIGLSNIMMNPDPVVVYQKCEVEICNRPMLKIPSYINDILLRAKQENEQHRIQTSNAIREGNLSVSRFFRFEKTLVIDKNMVEMVNLMEDDSLKLTCRLPLRFGQPKVAKHKNNDYGDSDDEEEDDENDAVPAISSDFINQEDDDQDLKRSGWGKRFRKQNVIWYKNGKRIRPLMLRLVSKGNMYIKKKKLNIRRCPPEENTMYTCTIMNKQMITYVLIVKHYSTVVDPRRPFNSMVMITGASCLLFAMIILFKFVYLKDMRNRLIQRHMYGKRKFKMNPSARKF